MRYKTLELPNGNWSLQVPRKPGQYLTEYVYNTEKKAREWALINSIRDLIIDMDKLENELENEHGYTWEMITDIKA